MPRRSSGDGVACLSTQAYWTHVTILSHVSLQVVLPGNGLPADGTGNDPRTVRHVVLDDVARRGGLVRAAVVLAGVLLSARHAAVPKRTATICAWSLNSGSGIAARGSGCTRMSDGRAFLGSEAYTSCRTRRHWDAGHAVRRWRIWLGKRSEGGFEGGEFGNVGVCVGEVEVVDP